MHCENCTRHCKLKQYEHSEVLCRNKWDVVFVFCLLGLMMTKNCPQDLVFTFCCITGCWRKLLQSRYREMSVLLAGSAGSETGEIMDYKNIHGWDQFLLPLLGFYVLMCSHAWKKMFYLVWTWVGCLFIIKAHYHWGYKTATDALRLGFCGNECFSGMRRRFIVSLFYIKSKLEKKDCFAYCK